MATSNAYTANIPHELTVSTSITNNYHHGDLRTALVDAALALLAEDGADAISLRAVARRAGVSAMAPYRHYPDKAALLAAVAMRGFDGLRLTLLAADAAPGQPLVAQAVAYVRYARQNPALFRLMFGQKRGDAHPELMASGETAYAVLVNRVAAETPDEAWRPARVLGCWSLVHGLALLFLDGLVKHPLAASEDEVTRLVAQAMLAHVPPQL